MKKIEEFIENKHKYIVLVILIIGILLRIVAIDKVPVGINVDEAGMAYDAYSIANYGIYLLSVFRHLYFQLCI